MISRVANSIYWLNRYVERAENYARFMDVNFNLSLELPPDVPEQWLPLIESSDDIELFNSLYKSPSKFNVIRFLGFDQNNPSSVYNCIMKARENARTVRPEITKEVWEQINAMYFFVQEAYRKRDWQKEDPREFFNQIKRGCHLLYGIIDATISRNEVWHFGNIGRLMERADKTSRMLDVKYNIILPSNTLVDSTFDIIQWAALLKSVSAYDAYRRNHGNLNSVFIIEFLIFNELFPRSIMRCVSQAELSLHLISGNNSGRYSNNAERLAGMIRSGLEMTNVNEVIQKGLHEFLDDIQIKLNDVSDEIFNMFFSKNSSVLQSMKHYELFSVSNQ